MSFSATGAVLIDVTIGPRPHHRLVIAQRQTAGLFVHAFFEVAITDAGFLGGRAQVKHMGHPRFDAEGVVSARVGRQRSEEHTSELQSLMRISYAVFCLKKKTVRKQTQTTERLLSKS